MNLHKKNAQAFIGKPQARTRKQSMEGEGAMTDQMQNRVQHNEQNGDDSGPGGKRHGGHGLMMFAMPGGHRR